MYLSCWTRFAAILRRFTRGSSVTISGDAPSSPVEAPCVCATHPVEAIYNSESSLDGRAHAVIDCNPDMVVSACGLSYGPRGFHPWVHTLRDFRNGRCTVFKASILQRWYEVCRPSSLAEYVLGRSSRELIGRLPPAAAAIPFELFADATTAVNFALSCAMGEARRALGELQLQCKTLQEASALMGPTVKTLGERYFLQLVDVYRSIHVHGHKRRYGHDGDIRGFLCRRGDEFRVIVRSGQHRAACLAALDAEAIPVRLLVDIPIEARDVDAWPLVRAGVWSREDALEFFDRVFDFDSRSWWGKLNIHIPSPENSCSVATPNGRPSRDS